MEIHKGYRMEKTIEPTIREIDLLMVFRWILIMVLVLIATFKSIDKQNVFIIMSIFFTYLIINIIARLFFTRFIEKPVFLFLVYLFDIGFVSSVLSLIGEMDQSFYLFYLITILLISITGGVKTSVPVSITSMFIFVYLTGNNNSKFLTRFLDTTYSLKIIFIFLTGIMSGLWKEIMEYKIRKNEKENQDKIIDITNFFKKIVSSIDEGIVVIDKDGNKIIENEQYKKLIEDEYDIPLIKNLRFMSENDRTLSTTFMTKDRRYILVKGYPLKNGNEKFDGSVGIVSDITKEKENIDFLNRTKNLANIGKMALYIAHEIRNPLNVIKGVTQLIELKTDKNEYTRMIIENVNRIDNIIEDLLCFSRKKNTMKEEIELLSFVKEVAINIKEDVRYKHTNIKVGIDEKLKICADKENLRRILVNLIINGIEASDKNPIIEIYSIEQKDFIHINVKDNGPGIPEELRDKIFEPFFTTKKNGTGLGLCIVDKLVQEEGGIIKVYTKSGEGTVFRVSLPFINKNNEEVIYERYYSRG